MSPRFAAWATRRMELPFPKRGKTEGEAGLGVARN